MLPELRLLIPLLVASSILASHAFAQEETGGVLGAPPTEGTAPTVSVDPTVMPDSTNAPVGVPNTPTSSTSNDEIPPPPQSGYTVPRGYGNHSPPRFVPTQPSFQGSTPIRRRVRVRVREGTQIPPEARVFEHRSKFFIIAGAIAFGVGYAISLAAGIIDEDRLLYAPVVGPLLWQLDEGTSDTAGLMVLLTLAQTAGAILFPFGMRKKTYAEWYAGERRISVAAAPTSRGGMLTLNVW